MGSDGHGTPAYRRIQAEILHRIEAGDLHIGDAVESERELARIHQVSLMTARHALAALEQDGVVERRRGTGTFVAPPKIHWNKLTSFTEQMSGRSLSAYSRVLCCSIIQDESEIAARLALPAHSRLVKLERLRLGAEEPFAIETCYLSAEQFAGLTKAPLERGSLFATLQQAYGVELAHADEEIDATAADPQTARLLEIPRGFPLLRIRQVIYSTKGQAVLYVFGLYHADRHTLRIRRYR